jgi:hypothetical protein
MSKASRDKKKGEKKEKNQNQSHNTKKESLGPNTDR